MGPDARRGGCCRCVLSPRAVLCTAHPFTNHDLQGVNSALAAGHNDLHWHPAGRHLPDTGELTIAAASACCRRPCATSLSPCCDAVALLEAAPASRAMPSKPPAPVFIPLNSGIASQAMPCRGTGLRVLQPVPLLPGAATLCQHLTAAVPTTLTACSLLSQAAHLQYPPCSLPACTPADQCLPGRPHRSGDHPGLRSPPGGLLLHVLHPCPGRLASL